jgi:hypothetical protein
VNFRATVTSSTLDPNLDNNKVTRTFQINSNPDDIVRLVAPTRVDLAFPFPLTLNVDSAAAAHDVDTTIDFRSDVDVKTMPEGCTNPAAGRVVCHSDAIAGGKVPSFVITLFAPRSYGDGYIDFTAAATERGVSPLTVTTRTRTQLWFTFYVTTTADSGAGSLRQAIFDANASADSPLAIGFRIDQPSTTPWKTIRVTSPLPAVTAPTLRIDGGTQANFFGDANPGGPELEINGGGTVDGDGLLIATCGVEVANLAIGSFLRNGLSVAGQSPVCTGFYDYTTQLHHLFIGVDPTGSSAHANSRGIGTSVPNGNNFNSAGVATNIHDCVISGNTFSGIFGLSGRLNVTNNRIGVKAHADEPLPNGSSGVFIGAGGYGSNVGPDSLSAFNAVTGGNVIAFNGETGVAIAAGVFDVALRNNRIWGNRLLGIDIGLDGPTTSSVSDSGDVVNLPVLTLAHFDPASNKTIIEGDIPNPSNRSFPFFLSFFASDAADPSGFGEGQRPIGSVGSAFSPTSTHFRFEADGDLTGQWITATNMHTTFNIAAKPEGIDQGYLTQTSEFSRAIAVQ